MEHSCYYCRVSSQLNMEQLDRFANSGMDAETFINQEYEDAMSSYMMELMKKHELKKLAEARFPATV